MRRLHRIAVALWIAAVLSAHPVGVAGQGAVVLGGGGSRGLAHAGVLQGLERRGYDFRVVVGTSMGSIVGALYAAGYAPDSIRSIIEATDWSDLFGFAPALLPDGARRPLLRYSLADARLRPQGLISDRGINRTLVRLLFDAGARAGNDFDRLPRRFRAMAADLATGRASPLGEGDLARAVRASMAVPGVFAPVAWDGRLLVDGGLDDNLPVAVARRLGGAQVVAVDVVRAEPTLDTRNPFRIATRAVRLLLRNAGEPGEPDVLIVPQIPPDFHAFEFPRDPGFLLDAGLAAGLAAPPAPGAGAAAPGSPPADTTRSEPPRSDSAASRPDSASSLAVAPRRRPAPSRDSIRGRQPGAPLAARRPAVAAPGALAALRVESPLAGVAPLVRATFSPLVPGSYDPRAVLAAVDRLYDSGLFEGVWPRVAGDTLVVLAEPRPRLQAAGAAGFDADVGPRAWAELEGWANPGRAMSGALTVSASPLRSEALARLARPTGNFPAAWTAGARARESALRRFDGDDVEGTTRVWRYGGWVGARLARLGDDWLASTEWWAEAVTARVGPHGFATGPRLRVERLPAGFQPVGIPAAAEVGARFGDVGYRWISGQGSLAAAVGRARVAAVARAAALAGDAPLDALPALGDEDGIPALRWGERRGHVAGLVGGDAAYPALPLGGWVRVRLRVGVDSRVPASLPARDGAVAGGALEAAWGTPLGPLEAGVAANTDGERRLTFDIGWSF